MKISFGIFSLSNYIIAYVYVFFVKKPNEQHTMFQTLISSFCATLTTNHKFVHLFYTSCNFATTNYRLLSHFAPLHNSLQVHRNGNSSVRTPTEFTPSGTSLPQRLSQTAFMPASSAPLTSLLSESPT